jgi:hypothetical protein
MAEVSAAATARSTVADVPVARNSLMIRSEAGPRPGTFRVRSPGESG